MDTGGKAGNQSATLITRAIALNEIQTSDFLYIFKEGVCCCHYGCFYCWNI
jgi:Mg/Co/Ni transporter MgtE